jgi:hypothetical protein
MNDNTATAKNVVGSGADGAAAIALADQLEPDVVVRGLVLRVDHDRTLLASVTLRDN